MRKSKVLGNKQFKLSNWGDKIRSIYSIQLNRKAVSFGRFLGVILACFFSFSFTSYAQFGGGGGNEIFPDLGDIQSQYNSYNLDMLGDDLVGDHTDIDTGALSLTQTDVSIPGNSGLSVSFGRSLSRQRFPNTAWLGGWAPTIPYISRHYLPLFGSDFGENPDRCSGDLYPDTQHVSGSNSHVIRPESYFSGYTLSIPGRDPGSPSEQLNGGGSPEFSGTNARLVTKNNWIITCLQNIQSGGEGFIAKAPNGDEYTFAYRQTYFRRTLSVTQTHDYIVNEEVLYVTEVKDVNNNWVKYEYAGGRPSRIHSNDGREITFGYSGSKISTVNANGRTWTYQYNSGGRLIGVTLPDNRTWAFAGGNNPVFDPLLTGLCAFHNSNSIPPVTIKHPSGAIAKFDFTGILNGRTHVIWVQADPGTPYPTLDDCHVGQASRTSATGFYSIAVTKKTLTVPSGGTYIWTRDYEEDYGSYNDYNGHPPDTKIRTITDPLGQKTKYYINRRFNALEGALMKIETIPSGHTTPLQTVTNTYITGHTIGKDLAGMHFGAISSGAKVRKLYKTQTITTRDGDSFTTEMSYATNQASSTYSFGSPTQTKSWSNVSSSPRITDTTYEHKKPNWILSLPSTVTQNGRELATYTYNDEGLKTAQSRYGQANFARFGYNSDGTLAWYKDALDRETKALNWKRGTAQKVIRPDFSEYEQIVDDNGWLEEYEDPMDHITSYSHDSMGRVTLIDPHGSWDNTSIDYDFTGGGAVQTITKGQMQTVVTYDGLFRPTLEHVNDLSSAWESYTNTAYDALGRTTFKSLPSATAAEPDGTSYTYDGLGRVITQTETAVNAVTLHEYLSGHRMRITDPEGGSKLYTSAGYDGPGSKDYRLIEEFGGTALMRSTEITKNIYGETEQVRQFGALNGIPVDQTQSFFYNAQRRLCGYSEDEGGDTLYDYDDAGQMIAYAKGQSNASSDCPAPAGDAKVSLTYDDLGQLLTTDFAHSGTPDIARDYDANGNLEYVNRGTGADAVNWTYTYHPDADLLTQEKLELDGHTFNLTYAYNNAQHMVSRKYPGGRKVMLNPDGMGRATHVHDMWTSQFTDNYSFHPSGAITQMDYASGYTKTMQLNSRLLPHTIKVENSSNAKVAMDLTYGYDLRGKITSITDHYDNTQNKSFTYDGLGQLLTNTGFWGPNNNLITASATYDSLGNIRSKGFGNRVVSLAYDTDNGNVNGKNRVIQSIDSQPAPIVGAPKISGEGAGGTGTRTVAYDNRGNVTSLGTMAFYYDYSDQPTVLSGTKTDGTSLTGNYRYDGHLKRVRNQVNGKTIYNVFDASGKLVHTRDITQDKTADYIIANGETVARWGKDHWIFDHQDHLGSTVAATHMNGNVNARIRYAPFGLMMDDPKKLRDGAGYTGHLKDSDTGLNYMQARYYDPVMGRFLSVDPVGFLETGAPGMFNRYAYVGNDPINLIDPDGQMQQQAPQTTFRHKAKLAGQGALAAFAVSNGGTVRGEFANPPIMNDSDIQAWAAGATAGAILGSVLGTKGGGGAKTLGTAVRQGGTKLADDALVARGGANITSESIERGTGTHPSAGITGFSAESAGTSLCATCTYIPNNQVGVTTVGEVRKAGGDVVSTSGRSPNHVTVTGLSNEKASQLLSPSQLNPVPKPDRK